MSVEVVARGAFVRGEIAARRGVTLNSPTDRSVLKTTPAERTSEEVKTGIVVCSDPVHFVTAKNLWPARVRRATGGLRPGQDWPSPNDS